MAPWFKISNRILSLFLLVTPGLSAPQSLDSVLTGVSGNVKNFRDSLPDFVCNERITSQNLDKTGKIADQLTVESVFSVRKRDAGRGPSLVEGREPLTINGKPAKKGTAFPKLPFRHGDGFSAGLFLTFHPDNLEFQTYKLAGSEGLSGNNALIIEFATKEGQQRLRYFERDGDSFALQHSGKAWIHLGAMQALRLDIRYLNTPNLNPYSSSIDYEEFDISGGKFWMPKKVKAEGTNTKSKTKGIYAAEYSNCRKFGASIEIAPVR